MKPIQNQKFKIENNLTIHRKSPTEPVFRSVAGYKVGNDELTLPAAITLLLFRNVGR